MWNISHLSLIMLEKRPLLPIKVWNSFCFILFKQGLCHQPQGKLDFSLVCCSISWKNIYSSFYLLHVKSDWNIKYRMLIFFSLTFNTVVFLSGCFCCGLGLIDSWSFPLFSSFGLIGWFYDSIFYLISYNFCLYCFTGCFRVYMTHF